MASFSNFVKTCSHWRDKVNIGDYTITVSEYYPHSDLYKEPKPDLGIYLSNLWESHFAQVKTFGETPKLETPVLPYPAVVVDWPDYGVISLPLLKNLISMIKTELEKGKKIDVGCYSAHGRTGTLLACLLGELEGRSARQSIIKVRQRYCKEAVDNASQCGLVASYLGYPFMSIVGLY